MNLELYTMKEVCSILGLSRTSIYKEIKSGKLTPTYVGSNRVRFTPESIHEYLSVCNNKKESYHLAAKDSSKIS